MYYQSELPQAVKTNEGEKRMKKKLFCIVVLAIMLIGGIFIVSEGTEIFTATDGENSSKEMEISNEDTVDDFTEKMRIWGPRIVFLISTQMNGMV